MIANSKSRHEEVRIRWRSWVMGLPGGVAWLRIVAKAAKWKESACGPMNVEFPGWVWA